MVLRGQQDEDAVLCTQSKTYSIKFVGTSNSVFLVPPYHSESYQCSKESDDDIHDQKAVASVIKLIPGNMELTEVAPRLDKLKVLLSENPYRCDDELEVENIEDNHVSGTGLYSWNDLVDNIQASDDEIMSGLQALSAIEINGHWRLVDESYVNTILRMLLHNSVLNDWSLNSLNEDEVLSMLESDGFPRMLAQHCLNVFSRKVNNNGQGSCVLKLDEKKVCIQFAREILREGKKKLEIFMDEWRQKLPDSMQPSLDFVEGEILTEKVGVETWVRAFSVSSLPSTPAERFSILFKERQKWEWKDLQPYIRFRFLI